MEWNFKVEPTEPDAEYNFNQVKLYFLLGKVISCLPFNFVGTGFVPNKLGKVSRKVKCKVSQNTTSFIGVNETTCFGLLGCHHQVCKVLRD